MFGADKTLGKMPAHITDGLRRALAAAQFLKHRLPSPSAAARQVDATVEAALAAETITPQLRQLLDDLVIAVKSGRDQSIQRQMVRGLAALMKDVTGECPGRSYLSSERNRSDVGEHGWFHKLSRRLAQFVSEHATMPVEMRAAWVRSLDGLVKQELKALRDEIRSRAA